MVNQKLFRYYVALAGMTCDTLAKEIGMNPATLSRKINGKSDFTLGEAMDVKRILGLSTKDVEQVFGLSL